MRNMRFVKGDSVEKQIESIDRVLDKFSRRIHKTVIITAPPSVISSHNNTLPEDGVVLRTIFPCKGVIKSIETYYSSEPGKQVSVNLFIINTDKQLAVSGSSINNVTIDKGDMIAVKIEGDVSNIWTSLLFVSDQADGVTNNLAIDKLDGISSDIAEGS